MKYTIQKEKGRPAYWQLYAQLRDDITAGRYPPGSRLPSKRQLCMELGISVITAEHAYSLLCEEGYAEPRQRSGYYALNMQGGCRPADVRRETHRGGSGEYGEFPFPFSVLSRAMRRTISEWQERLVERSPNNGCEELREALRDYLLRSRDIAVTPEQIVVGSGAEYLYSLVAQLLGRESVIALEEPSYSPIRQVYEAQGIRCEGLALGEDGIPDGELERATGRVLHVTPYHSFPSGVTASMERRGAYLSWTRERQGILVEDDFDSEFTLSRRAEPTVFSLSPEDGVIYLNSFSRTIGPGLRVGYMLLPPPLLERYGEKLGFYSCTVPVFEQLLLAELLNSGDFERHINRVRRQLRRSPEERQEETA